MDVKEKQPMWAGCRICGDNQRIHVFPDDVTDWQNGKLIQDAMPYLSADERELIISGTCGKCFDEMFGECDEQLFYICFERT